MQSHVRFNRGSGEGSGESLGGFGAEPGQVQRVSGEGSGRFNEVREVPEGVVESRARFKEVPEKVLEKVPEGFWCGQVQRGFK